MKKKYIVKKNTEFNKIINKKQLIKNKYFVVYYFDNNLKYNRYGISVGTKIGNAVLRNKYKRRIRCIVDNYKKDFSKGLDCIIILRKGSLQLSYQDMCNELQSLMKGIENEKKK